MHPIDPQFLIDIKLGKFSYDKANEMRHESILNIKDMANVFYSFTPNIENQETLDLLHDVQYNIMRNTVQKELL